MPALIASLAASLADAVRVFTSARRVAVAVDAGRSPTPRDLGRLGIDPAAFARIGRT